MRLNDKRGMALVFTFYFVVILMALGGLFILSAVHEKNMATIEREQAKAFYAAQGGSQTALVEVDTLINNYLQATIASATPSGVISYAQSKVNSGDGIGWLVYAVRDNNVPVLTQDGDEAFYTGSGTLSGGEPYAYNITFTEKEDPSEAPGDDAWDFPFSYRISASGSSDDLESAVTVRGDFTVRVQRDNFAKYALFTNSQTSPGGSTIWFTASTNFSGPVHTNGRFNFAHNPSGTFLDEVTQQEQEARFYNGSSASVLLDDDHNGTIDVPTFGSTFTRGADQIDFSSSTDESDMSEQALGGATLAGNGIYVPNDGSSLTGGIYIQGDGGVTMSVDANNHAVYTVTQGSETRIITVDESTNQTTVEDPSTSSVTTYTGSPDGLEDVGTLIYGDGTLEVSGTVQEDTEITIAGQDDVMITDNISYESYTPGSGTPGQPGYVPPTAEGAGNVLGLMSWQGDVRITTAAPDDVQVYGTIMAPNGVLTVDDYNDTSVGPRGTATLLGGVITDNYGAFFLFSGYTGQQLSGFGRNFVYDERMQEGTAPPYFPTLETFIAFTNDIADKLVWQEGSE